MNSIISLKDIKKEYRLGQTTVEALQGVTLKLEEGRYYSIMGPSGSGKSSLLHIIGCMDTPTMGEVIFNSKSLNGLKEHTLTKIRARDIGFIFQAFYLNPILTVLDNVSIALRILGIGKKKARYEAEKWLDRVGLSHRIRHYPSELSGGERQRAAIARAIVKKPALILADEPTGNLDSKKGMEIIELLRKINTEEKTTIVQVTHNSEVAEKSDTIIEIRDGQIVHIN